MLLAATPCQQLLDANKPDTGTLQQQELRLIGMVTSALSGRSAAALAVLRSKLIVGSLQQLALTTACTALPYKCGHLCLRGGLACACQPHAKGGPWHNVRVSESMALMALACVRQLPHAALTGRGWVVQLEEGRQHCLAGASCIAVASSFC